MGLRNIDDKFFLDLFRFYKSAKAAVKTSMLLEELNKIQF